MNLKTYQQLTSRTNADLGHPGVNAAHVTLGIVGETDEAFQAYKEYFLGLEIQSNVVKEFGDVLWYMSELANEFNIELKVVEFQKKKDIIIHRRIGWIAENIKKYLAYNKPVDVQILSDHLNNILSEIKYYLETVDYTLEECLDLNIEKLQKRYPEKFSAIDALDKKDEQADKPKLGFTPGWEDGVFIGFD